MGERAVFFDLGNTLLQPVGRSARRMLGERLGLTEKDVRRAGRLIMTRPHRTPEALAAELSKVLSTRDPGHVLGAVRAVWREQMDRVALHPDAIELLDRLKAAAFCLGLLSNLWEPVIASIESSFPGLMRRFDHLLLSCRLGVKKPSPAIFNAAITAAGMPPGCCWMVGDSYELDLEPAMKAGMRTVWVLSRPEAERGLLAQSLRGEIRLPDCAVAELLDLPRLLTAGLPGLEGTAG
jgi:HAD superfamily hydrolase (TIGR01509 family)